jgi:23S rRNA G2445 N2-methylase RlmL
VARHEVQVVTTPGLEAVTAAELTRLGVRVGRTGRGGLSCDMTFPQIVLANLQLRTATRVVVRLKRFRAERFQQVTAGTQTVDWSQWLDGARPVRIRASATGSRLFHTDAIADAVRTGLPDGTVFVEPGDDVPGQVVPATISVRVAHDTATLSIDSSGDALHRRGWRTHVGDAPMRETLAAALLLWSGWSGRTPVLDPCCGAGTILVEAATLARRIAPGAGRAFAFETWPSADRAAIERIRAGVAADVLSSVKARLVGGDVDEAVIAAAVSNAQRAGVADDIAFDVVDVRERGGAPLPVVTNPPYGLRLRADLPSVQRGIARCATTITAVLPATGSVAWLGRPVLDEVATTNGGVPVRFVRTDAPTAGDVS